MRGKQQIGESACTSKSTAKAIRVLAESYLGRRLRSSPSEFRRFWRQLISRQRHRESVFSVALEHICHIKVFKGKQTGEKSEAIHFISLARTRLSATVDASKTDYAPASGWRSGQSWSLRYLAAEGREGLANVSHRINGPSLFQ